MGTVNLEGAVQLFDLYCRSKGLAERTLETYRDALRGLTAFLEGAGRWYVTSSDCLSATGRSSSRLLLCGLWARRGDSGSLARLGGSLHLAVLDRRLDCGYRGGLSLRVPFLAFSRASRGAIHRSSSQ